jgi:hypothetical protein
MRSVNGEALGHKSQDFSYKEDSQCRQLTPIA